MSASFPPDIEALAERIAGNINSQFDSVLIAAALLAERKAGAARYADAILAKRYTEDQGIDAEMEAFNGGLEEAAKLLRELVE